MIKVLLTRYSLKVIATLILFSGCEQFEYHAYETNRYNPPAEASNAYNLQLLNKIGQKDTLRLIFIGDTQRYYDDLKDAVQAINNVDEVDAVIIAGDLVEFAFSKEYQWVAEELVKLKVPFLTVVGNHDCLANGIEAYKHIYGPLNYSFTWNRIRFIMHNTNSREFSFDKSAPDLDWMTQALADENNYDYSLFVSHVPPYHDDFDEELEYEYTQIIRNSKNTLLAVNGHQHYYALNQPYQDGIWYLNTSSPANRAYAYVTLYTKDDAQKKFDCAMVQF